VKRKENLETSLKKYEKYRVERRKQKSLELSALNEFIAS
jgi:hypothetical protein